MEPIMIILIVVSFLLSLSEILGTFEVFKSNSIFQLAVSILKTLKEKLSK